ncbi:MAG: amino acid adenylation domain-containing protein [Planctomycetota bacterium]
MARPSKLQLSAKKRQLLQSLLGKEGLPATETRIPKRADPGPAPLSYAQERVWFLEQMAAGTPVFNVPGAVPLRGPLDVAALRAALATVVARHDVLRTTLAVRDGHPVQVIAAAEAVAAPSLPVVDLGAEPAASRWERVRAAVQDDAQRPFDLAQGPLWRATLFRLQDREHVLWVCMHHSISEAAALGVLFDELAADYGPRVGVEAGGRSLAELPIQYADYAAWQRGWVEGADVQRQLGFWREQLRGPLPTVQLPLDRPRQAQPSLRGGFAHHRLDASLTQPLIELAQREGATPFMLFLAAFAALLSRYGDQEDLPIGSPIARRDRAELTGLIGFFVNTIVLRADLSGAPTFRELLRRMRDVSLAAYDNSDVPFELVVDALRPERDQSVNPLFQVMFDLPAEPRPKLQLPGLEPARVLEPWDVHSGTTKVDLALFLWRLDDAAGGGMESAIEYSADLFDPSTIDRILGHYEQLLRGIAADPDQSIASLPLLTDAERRQVLVEWNATDRAFPRDVCVQQLVEAQVAATPDALAVASPAGSISYAEWNRDANRLAHHLRSLGVGPDVLVAVCMERTLEMVTALLAILKAGGAYVPLDPGNPAERQAMMLEDAEVPVLLTQESVLPRLPQTTRAQVLVVDRDAAAWSGQGDGDPELVTSAEHLAYVIFTSGSTGRPKGVQIPHRGLMNLVAWHQRVYSVTAADRATQVAGLAFDASVWELWPYFTAGASVRLPDEETRAAPEALLAWLAAERVTVCFLPTPLAELVLQLPQPSGLSLRAMLTGGDKLHRPPPADLPYELINHYGPSESSVVSTSTTVPPGGAAEASAGSAPPIGRPIDNVQVYIVDPRGEPVPVGVPGELWVGGDSLARGYHRRPDLTAERFVSHPFASDSTAKLYRTGDLVRWRPDGQIEFLGRIDHQVKVRGFRIELGEIEAVMRRHDAVRESLVLLRGDVPGEQRLVGYCIAAAESSAVSPAELRAFCAERLPDYMIPASFVFLESFPLTRNGKIDRAALPAPTESATASAGDRAPPSTELEQQIATLWAKALGAEQVGIDDNFFELGGNSLLMVRLRGELETALGRSLSMVQLFRHPTVRALAEALGDAGSGASAEVRAKEAEARREDAKSRRESMRRRRERRVRSGGRGRPGGADPERDA